MSIRIVQNKYIEYNFDFILNYLINKLFEWIFKNKIEEAIIKATIPLLRWSRT